MADNSRVEKQLRKLLGEDVEVEKPQSRVEELIQRLIDMYEGGGGGGGDGISPTVEITTITGGHRVSITDVNGTETFDILDGNNGTPGTDGTTFTPAVSSAGVISWTNDGNEQNPQSVDLVAAVLAALPTWTGGSY